jgi:hypothetical protein
LLVLLSGLLLVSTSAVLLVLRRFFA